MTEKSSTKALPQDPFKGMQDFDQQGSDEAVPEAIEPQATAQHDSTDAKSKTPAGKKKAKSKSGTGPKGEKKARAKSGTGPKGEKKAKVKSGTRHKGEKKAKAKSGTGPKGEKKAKVKSGTGQKGQKKAKAKSGTGLKGEKKAKAKSGTGQKSKKEESGQTSRPTVEKRQSSGKDTGSVDVGPDATTPKKPGESPTLPDRLGPDTEPEKEGDKRQSTEMDLDPVQAGEDGSEGEPRLEELIAIINEEIDETFGPGAMADLDQEASVGIVEAEQHVIFSLGDTEFAVPISHVTEIGRPLNVSTVPNVPVWLLGIANLRGEIISMVDLRAFLGMERVGFDPNRRMIVAEAIREDLRVGLIVDRVTDINHLELAGISEPTAKIDDQVAQYLRGVYEHEGQLLVLLDLDRLLLSTDMRQFEPL